MKLHFPISQLTKLTTLLNENPEANAVSLTSAEFTHIISELLQLGDPNAVLMSQKERIFFINNRTIKINVIDFTV